MRALILLASGYPGPYVPPAITADARADGWIAVAGPAVGVFIFAVIVCLAFEFADDFGSESTRARVAGSLVAVAAAVGFIWCGSLLVSLIGDFRDEVAKDQAAYGQTLVDWLADDYGIDTDVTTVERLLAGETFVTEYDGRQVTVGVSDTLEGSKVLVDENKAALPVLEGK
jgi:hypothetical protein